MPACPPTRPQPVPIRDRLKPQIEASTPSGSHNNTSNHTFVSPCEHRIRGMLPVDRASGTPNAARHARERGDAKRHQLGQVSRTANRLSDQNQGSPGPEWTQWFEGRCITFADNGDTLLTGPVVDQAELYGLLRRVRDLGIPLVSVCPVRMDLPVAFEQGEQQ